MSDRSAAIPQPSPRPSSAPAKTAPAPAAAARTKMLLEAPILPTLLRLAAPNILNLLAFAGVITFDGFFLRRLAGLSLGDDRPANDQQRHGCRRLVRDCPGTRRGPPRARGCAGFPRLS